MEGNAVPPQPEYRLYIHQLTQPAEPCGTLRNLAEPNGICQQKPYYIKSDETDVLI